MDHPNAVTARRFFDAIDQGDMATVEAMLADDLVAHWPGSHRLSGTYKGRDEFFAAFARLQEVTGGNFERELHDITASDDHAVILVKITLHRDDETISWNAANVWHVRDGKMTEVWFLVDDQDAVTRALS